MRIESGEDILLATVTGSASLRRGLELYKAICDRAQASGFAKILTDCLSVTGEISMRERHIFGKEAVDYQRSKGMSLKIAFVGQEPALNGVGVVVAQNRGLNVELFSDRQRALAWLQRPQFNAEPFQNLHLLDRRTRHFADPAVATVFG